MNKEEGGWCNTVGMKYDRGKYLVPVDKGRNPLTGSSNIDEFGVELFTFVEREVFTLE